MPPAEVPDLEQRSAELVEIPVTRAAEPCFKTSKLEYSVVVIAGKQHENTLRCSLTEGVAEKERDDVIEAVGSYEVFEEHHAPDDRLTSDELVEIPEWPVAEPNSETDQREPRKEDVDAFRGSLVECVRRKARNGER